jgi:hypothetical protein
MSGWNVPFEPCSWVNSLVGNAISDRCRYIDMSSLPILPPAVLASHELGEGCPTIVFDNCRQMFKNSKHLSGSLSLVV